MTNKAPEKNIFRTKVLFPLSYACVVALAIWGATGLIPNSTAATQPNPTAQSSYFGIEPAAGDELNLAQIDMDPQIPAISETEIIDVPELELTPAEGVDATEMTPLRISPDKPEIVQLDRSAVNILVGNDENLRAVPDTNRTIILIPKKPGATYFKAIDADGKVIMQRHVIVGAAKNEYVRIRRACINGEDGCKQYSMYYCPDSCHEVDLIQDTKAASDNAAPDKTTSPNSVETTNTDEPVTE